MDIIALLVPGEEEMYINLLLAIAGILSLGLNIYYCWILWKHYSLKIEPHTTTKVVAFNDVSVIPDSQSVRLPPLSAQNEQEPNTPQNV